MKPTRGGAVAGGHPRTVDAGLRALSMGGNAVDAAFAAKAMACVAEPMLTGLLGGGLGIVRFNGQTRICDFFANVPGAQHPAAPPAPMDQVALDFGPDSQMFHLGPGSVAVPGLIEGLWSLHTRFGTLPIAALLQPAIEAAQSGVIATEVVAVAAHLLEPILVRDPHMSALLRPGGRPIEAGTVFTQPALARTLEALVAEGPRWLRSGAGATAVLTALGGRSRLSRADLAGYRAEWRPTLTGHYRGATLHMPGPPSQAGAQVLQTLAVLEAGGPLPPPTTGAHLARVAHAMQATEAAKGEDFQARLFDEGFVAGWLARGGAGSGFTTHVSTIDAAGNAVGLTSSLGETAGLMCPETGLMLNNFLGEDDVNPTVAARPPGARLMTMCCPCLLEWAGKRLVLGTGGSSRIRSALLHGVVYGVDHAFDARRLVDAPRAHFEGGVLRYESTGRPPEHRAMVDAAFDDIVEFPEPGLFFGGLHVAGLGPDGFFGAGDFRRAGAFGEVES